MLTRRAGVEFISWVMKMIDKVSWLMDITLVKELVRSRWRRDEDDDDDDEDDDMLDHKTASFILTDTITWQTLQWQL